MAENKRFIYFPSLSAGSMVSAFKKDMKFESGDPVKFFDSRYPAEWRHPYFWLQQDIITRKWIFAIKWD